MRGLSGEGMSDIDELKALVHDLFVALQALCDGNECEYCVMSYDPWVLCPVDELRARIKEDE